MAKKKERDETDVANEGAIFVNAEKLQRAKDIIVLVSGKKAPKDGTEMDIKERWAGHFADAEMTAKDEGAVLFVYEKLGGLVRTPVEQDVHEEKVEEMKAKNKKRRIE